jgi:hypothetical protein
MDTVPGSSVTQPTLISCPFHAVFCFACYSILKIDAKFYFESLIGLHQINGAVRTPEDTILNNYLGENLSGQDGLLKAQVEKKNFMV